MINYTIRIPILPLVLHMLEYQRRFFTFTFTILKYFGSLIKLFWKKYSLSFLTFGLNGYWSGSAVLDVDRDLTLDPKQWLQGFDLNTENPGILRKAW
jgi:hypothetical protein